MAVSSTSDCAPDAARRRSYPCARLPKYCGCTKCGRSQQEISFAIGASPTTVGEYLRRAKSAGIGYPLPVGIDEPVLRARLFPPPLSGKVAQPELDWAMVHRDFCAV